MLSTYPTQAVFRTDIDCIPNTSL